MLERKPELMVEDLKSLVSLHRKNEEELERTKREMITVRKDLDNANASIREKNKELAILRTLSTRVKMLFGGNGLTESLDEGVQVYNDKLKKIMQCENIEQAREMIKKTKIAGN